MFWNDITDIKNKLDRLENILLCARNSVNSNCDYLGRDMGEVVKDSLIDILESEDEYNSINRIHDKLNTLIDDANRQQQVLLAEKTLDKFEDYMKNVDKLNGMINEFKGCVSLARGALEERKKASEQEAKTAVLADITQEIYKAMLSFIQAGEKLEHKAHYKIDAIYKVLFENEEKKSHKKRKYTKRKKGKGEKQEVSDQDLVRV